MRTITLACILSITAWAAPPEFKTSSVSVQVGKIGYITPQTDAASVVYLPQSGFEFVDQSFLGSKTKAAFVCTAKAGKYTVVAVAAAKDGEQKLFEVLVVVTADETMPPAKDDVPPPPPVPTEKGRVVVQFVEATQNAQIIRAKLFDAGQPLRKWQDDGGHQVGAATIDTTDASFARYVQAARDWVAQGNKLPFMLIVGKLPTGEMGVLWKGKTPDAPGEVLQLLQRYSK